MDALPTGTRQKALALNLDKAKYGTIAASVSAHDMAVGGAFAGSARGPRKESSFLYIRNRIASPERRTLSQARLSQRRESDMSSGRSLGLLCTNSLTFPRPLALFADSARLGPTDAELRGVEVSRNPQ